MRTVFISKEQGAVAVSPDCISYRGDPAPQISWVPAAAVEISEKLWSPRIARTAHMFDGQTFSLSRHLSEVMLRSVQGLLGCSVTRWRRRRRHRVVMGRQWSQTARYGRAEADRSPLPARCPVCSPHLILISPAVSECDALKVRKGC